MGLMASTQKQLFPFIYTPSSFAVCKRSPVNRHVCLQLEHTEPCMNGMLTHTHTHTHAQSHTHTCAWRAIEQHPPRRLHLEALKQVRVQQRQEHHLLQRAHIVVQPADLVEVNAGVYLLRTNIAANIAVLMPILVTNAIDWAQSQRCTLNGL
eukprot:scaffold178956_cov24-Tisochrysis_lutea.AAC.1